MEAFGYFLAYIALAALLIYWIWQGHRCQKCQSKHVRYLKASNGNLCIECGHYWPAYDKEW